MRFKYDTEVFLANANRPKPQKPKYRICKDSFPIGVPTIGAVQKRDSDWHFRANPEAHQAQVDFEEKDRD
jgi:hypothetical protein